MWPRGSGTGGGGGCCPGGGCQWGRSRALGAGSLESLERRAGVPARWGSPGKAGASRARRRRGQGRRGRRRTARGEPARRLGLPRPGPPTRSSGAEARPPRPSPAVCISLAGGGARLERNRLHLERCLFFLTSPRRQTTLERGGRTRRALAGKGSGLGSARREGMRPGPPAAGLGEGSRWGPEGLSSS